MKFIVSSSSLLKQLQHISGVINANTVLPILEDFLFEVEKNKLTVVATDVETVMRIQLDIEAKDSGKACIPARILLDSLKNIPDQPLTFNIDKNFGIEITSDNERVAGWNFFFDHGKQQLCLADAMLFGQAQVDAHGVQLALVSGYCNY